MCSSPQRSHCCRCPPRAGVRHAPIARRALRWRGRGPVGAQERLAPSLYDRAEVRLGGHTSLARALDGGTQDTFERADHVAQRRGRDMCVRLGGMDVGVAEQYLHDARARAFLN